MSAKNFIAAALQRNMEMRHESIAVCYQLNDFIGEQVGLDGGNAVTRSMPLYFIQRLNQFSKSFPHVFFAPSMTFAKIT